MEWKLVEVELNVDRYLCNPWGTEVLMSNSTQSFVHDSHCTI